MFYKADAQKGATRLFEYTDVIQQEPCATTDHKLYLIGSGQTFLLSPPSSYNPFISLPFVMVLLHHWVMADARKLLLTTEGKLKLKLVLESL